MARKFAAFYDDLLGYAYRKVALLISGDEADHTSAPTLTGGSAAPSASEPNGSRYFRTNGYGYRRVGGAWELVEGAAGTISADTISELTAAAGVTIDGLLLKDGFVAASDNQGIKLGNTAAAPDITIAWDATRLAITQGTANSEVRWGVDGAGLDQLWYGDTASTFAMWDQSRDTLALSDNAKLGLGSGAGAAYDIEVTWNGTALIVSQLTANSAIQFGASGAGIDLVLYGDTATYDCTWDQSLDTLLFADNAKLGLGSGAGAGADITLLWDGSKLVVGQLTPNSAIDFGVDGAGIDLILRGDTASAAITWDQSDDSLVLSGVAKIKHQTIAAATGTAIPVTHSGSFPITQNGAETNTLADPTFLGQWLSIFVDTDTSGARVITAASRINQAGNVTITLTEVGDFIKLEAITIGGALKWQVVANDGAALS